VTTSPCESSSGQVQLAELLGAPSAHPPCAKTFAASLPEAPKYAWEMTTPSRTGRAVSRPVAQTPPCRTYGCTCPSSLLAEESGAFGPQSSSESKGPILSPSECAAPHLENTGTRMRGDRSLLPALGVVTSARRSHAIAGPLRCRCFPHFPHFPHLLFNPIRHRIATMTSH
jgi:hypothetical protein